MESTDIFVDTEDSGVREVKIAPVVVFNVLDHYIRRTDSKQRVIGTLLGRQTSTGTVYITDSFPLPHSETGDNVSVESDYFMKMYELQRRVTSSEELVGWYATGTETDIKSLIIHEFYGRHCVNPVHVLIDSQLNNDKMNVNAFISTTYKIENLSLNSEFQSIPVSVKPEKAERVGLDVLFKKKRIEEQEQDQPQKNMLANKANVSPQALSSEIDNLEHSMQKLLDLLDTVGRNVDAVVTGKIEGDVNTGRFLAETLTMVPRMNNADFERLFGDNMRDLLMVAYLCKLTKSQLTVGEKLLGIDVPAITNQPSTINNINNNNNNPNHHIASNATSTPATAVMNTPSATTTTTSTPNPGASLSSIVQAQPSTTG